MAITYPVDVENTRWAVYSLSEGQVVSRNKRWPRADGGALVGADPNFVLLLQVEQPMPEDSPTHEFVQGEMIDVDAQTLMTTYTKTPRDLEEARSSALLAVANKRWEVEVNHPTFDTSREAQAQINKAWMAVQIDPNRIFNYKAKDGTWQQFDKAQIEAIAGAISAWVEDCFDREKDLADAVNAATSIADLESILTNDLPTGWPS